VWLPFAFAKDGIVGIYQHKTFSYEPIDVRAIILVLDTAAYQRGAIVGAELKIQFLSLPPIRPI
jgi:hypothetical protein